MKKGKYIHEIHAGEGKILHKVEDYPQYPGMNPEKFTIEFHEDFKIGPYGNKVIIGKKSER